MPNMRVFRPGDAIETAECWQIALSGATGRPCWLCPARTCPQLADADAGDQGRAAGAYELAGPSGEAQVSLFASGSEVAIAVGASKLLAERGVAARVVSVPCSICCSPIRRRRAEPHHRQGAGQDRG